MFNMRTTSNKPEAEPAPPKPADTKPPDIASASVPDTLAALHMNPERGLTHGEVATRPAAILAVAGARFAMAVAVG